MPKSYSDQIQAIEPKTIAGKLQSDLPEIDRKLREGTPYADLIEALSRGGLTVSREALRSAIRRYREKVRNLSAVRQIGPQPQSAPTTAGQPPDTTEPTPSMPGASELRATLNRQWSAEEIEESQMRAAERRRQKHRTVTPNPEQETE